MRFQRNIPARGIFLTTRGPRVCLDKRSVIKSQRLSLKQVNNSGYEVLEGISYCHTCTMRERCRCRLSNTEEAPKTVATETGAVRSKR